MLFSVATSLNRPHLVESIIGNSVFLAKQFSRSSVCFIVSNLAFSPVVETCQFCRPQHILRFASAGNYYLMASLLKAENYI